MMMKTLGIDLGGTNTKYGVLAEGKVLFQVSYSTPAGAGYQAVLDELVFQSQSILDSYPEIAFLGVGSPGLVDIASGTVLYSNNFGWSNVPLGFDLSARLGRTVRIANDAHCAALGEALHGAGRGCGRMAMLTIGTGIGGGFVREGQLEGDCYGSMAYIFGHMAVEPIGRTCNCGRQGCLEAYASAGAMARECRQMMPEIQEVKEVFAAARAGNERAVQMIERLLGYLCIGVVNLANILRPHKIVLGGGVSGSGDLILPKLRQALEQEVYGYSHAPVEAVCAVLGNSAGLVGAGSLHTQER